MKLGELLIRERLITAAQLDQALGLHKRFGYRVGSILVELGYLDVDMLARALSGLQRVPAVLSKHVAAIDPKVVAVFKPRLASQCQAIPLGYTQTTPRRLLVALRDPGTTPTEEIAFAAGCRVDVAVAPEILVRRALERYYGLKHDWSELRLAISGGGGDIGGDSWPPTSAPVAAPPPSAPQVAPPPSRPSSRRMVALSAPPPPSAPQVAPPPPSVPVTPASTPSVPRISEEELEAARRELSEEGPDEVPLDAVKIDPSSAEFKAEAAWDDFFEEAPALPRALTAPPGLIRPVLDAAAAAAALADATTREEVGETLTSWLQTEYACGLVLIVKDGTALGWKGHARDVEQDLIESIAMPLGPASMLTVAHESRVVFHGPPPAEGATLQTRLWKLLRCTPPSEVLVAPVLLGQRVVNLIYAHAEGALPESAVSDATRVAAAAATAYARLIKKKK